VTNGQAASTFFTYSATLFSTTDLHLLIPILPATIPNMKLSTTYRLDTPAKIMSFLLIWALNVDALPRGESPII
jgi:hypothetical protein